MCSTHRTRDTVEGACRKKLKRHFLFGIGWSLLNFHSVAFVIFLQILSVFLLI